MGVICNEASGPEGGKIEARGFGAGDVDFWCCDVRGWIGTGNGVVGFGVRDETSSVGTVSAVRHGEVEVAEMVVGLLEFVAVGEVVELDGVSAERVDLGRGGHVR